MGDSLMAVVAGSGIMTGMPSSGQAVWWLVEINIRRPVGAKRSEIRIQFMIEAFTISVLGGVAGSPWA